MDESIIQWLAYLENRLSNMDANRRIRSSIIFASGSLLIGSILFIASGGPWWLGLLGIIMALALLIASALASKFEFIYVGLVEKLIRDILNERLKSGLEIEREMKSIEKRSKETSVTQFARGFRKPRNN